LRKQAVWAAKHSTPASNHSKMKVSKQLRLDFGKAKWYSSGSGKLYSEQKRF